MSRYEQLPQHCGAPRERTTVTTVLPFATTETYCEGLQGREVRKLRDYLFYMFLILFKPDWTWPKWNPLSSVASHIACSGEKCKRTLRRLPNCLLGDFLWNTSSWGGCPKVEGSICPDLALLWNIWRKVYDHQLQVWSWMLEKDLGLRQTQQASNRFRDSSEVWRRQVFCIAFCACFLQYYMLSPDLYQDGPSPPPLQESQTVKPKWRLREGRYAWKMSNFSRLQMLWNGEMSSFAAWFFGFYFSRLGK